MQNDTRRPRPSRRKILLFALAALAAVAALSFRHARSVDLAAWPAPAPGVSPGEPAYPADGAVDLVREAGFLQKLPDPATAPLDAYRRFQAVGLAALSEADLAALDARLAELDDEEQGIQVWIDTICIHGFFAVSTPAEANAAAEWIGRSPEMTVLTAYAAARGPEFSPDDLGGLDRMMLRTFTRGAGLIGYAAALPNTMLLAREALMHAADTDGNDATNRRVESSSPEPNPARAIRGLRAAENAIAPLADAIRDDWRVHRAAAREFYASMAPGATNGPSAATKWFVRKLGGTEETTLAHVDALFSRLVENAALPYSPDGLAAGLPGWCLGKGRPPWTRDPAGAALARNYLRHAGAAAAIPPGIRLELRAARVAVALRMWRDAHGGEWPASLDPLCEGEEPVLLPGDVADPFSPDGARLRYEREPDGSGWRLWSVGLDQADGNGAVDAFHAEGADVKSSDFVFSSRERALRRAAAGTASR